VSHSTVKYITFGILSTKTSWQPGGQNKTLKTGQVGLLRCAYSTADLKLRSSV